jgi:hypothetical protein
MAKRLWITLVECNLTRRLVTKLNVSDSFGYCQQVYVKIFQTVPYHHLSFVYKGLEAALWQITVFWGVCAKVEI